VDEKVGTCSMHKELKNTYKILAGKPEGKRPFWRPGGMWEDDIKIDLKEIGYDDMDWSQLAQDRVQWQALVKMLMNLHVP
jgi:hypothetical protein